jgi:phosphonate transport system permease protein
MSTRVRAVKDGRFSSVGVVHVSLVAALVMLVSSWVFVLGWERQQSFSFFSTEAAGRAWGFIQDLAGVGRVSQPAYADLSEWSRTARLAYDTLAMSVLAIMIAALGALATFMLGARNVMRGGGLPAVATFGLVRASWAFTRAVPEFVWALLAVFIFSPGIVPGAIALAIHNYGVLGKLAAEVVEGMDMRPVEALRSSGAGRNKALLYGVLPQVLPRFMTYLLYRWEVVMRTTIVVGFVAAGGLGMEFRLAMSSFHYTTVTLLLMWYLALVLGVDAASAGLRRLAR